jgi:hypothetical protein
MTCERSESYLYLKMYPRLRKWINQCVACQTMGHRPDMPHDEPWSKNLARYFPELPLNSTGLCAQCGKMDEAGHSK